MKRFSAIALASIFPFLLTGCLFDSDDTQRRQQETILQEGRAQVGMPAIKNFRELKLVKMLLEKRDQENLVTYTYTFSEVTGETKFFCTSVGYAIPYATQFTNPEKYESSGTTLPQADPSGLFSPSSADASWVMCKAPDGSVNPVYVEPKVVVSPYRLS